MSDVENLIFMAVSINDFVFYILPSLGGFDDFFGKIERVDIRERRLLRIIEILHDEGEELATCMCMGGGRGLFRHSFTAPTQASEGEEG